VLGARVSPRNLRSWRPGALPGCRLGCHFVRHRRMSYSTISSQSADRAFSGCKESLPGYMLTLNSLIYKILFISTSSLYTMPV